MFIDYSEISSQQKKDVWKIPKYLETEYNV